MATAYTPAPQVEGEILTNDGKRALVVDYLEDGEMHLSIYEWVPDRRYRYNDLMGNWGVLPFGVIYLTRAERRALSGVFK